MAGRGASHAPPVKDWIAAKPDQGRPGGVGVGNVPGGGGVRCGRGRPDGLGIGSLNPAPLPQQANLPQPQEPRPSYVKTLRTRHRNGRARAADCIAGSPVLFSRMRKPTRDRTTTRSYSDERSMESTGVV
jgi:hypothetical protein